MRYPSGLRIHCVKDEGKKKLMVPFKTAHNTISCQKQNKRQTKAKQKKTQQTQKTQTTLFHHIFLLHYFLCFSVSSFVLLSLVLRCLTWSSLFLDFISLVERAHVLKIILSCVSFAIWNRLSFHFNIAVGTVFHKCTHIFEMRWNSGKRSCLVTVSARDFCSWGRAVQCMHCGV